MGFENFQEKSGETAFFIYFIHDFTQKGNCIVFSNDDKKIWSYLFRQTCLLHRKTVAIFFVWSIKSFVDLPSKILQNL